MAKYKVNQIFRDKETGILHVPSKSGESIELTVKRADEINKTLGDFVERVEDEKPQKDKK